MTKQAQSDLVLKAARLMVILGRMRELSVSAPFLAVLETSLTTLIVGIVLAFLLGFPLGVGVIVITIVLTNIYVRRANTEFDEINRQIVAEAKK